MHIDMISRANYDYIADQIWPAGLGLTHVISGTLTNKIRPSLLVKKVADF